MENGFAIVQLSREVHWEERVVIVTQTCLPGRMKILAQESNAEINISISNKKVNLSLCLTKYYPMKAYEGVDI